MFLPCKGGLFSGKPLFASVTTSSGLTIARIFAKCVDNEPYKEFYIEIEHFRGTGTYPLTDSNINCQYIERYYPDKTYVAESGTLTITKDDRTSQILSGTFSFTAVNVDNPAEVINITDGRFDISTKQ